LNFWKRLTDELGARFLGARPTVSDTPGHGYPVLAEAEFKAATGHWTPIEVERLMCSPRASDWTAWNAIQLLKSAHPDGWWNDLSGAAARINPSNYFSTEGIFPLERAPEAGFWKTVPPSDGYDQWRRAQMRQTPRNGRDLALAADSSCPLEPPSRVDLSFSASHWLVFAESRCRQDFGAGTSHDPRRNRIVQLADCLVTAAQGRRCALWIFASDRSPDREYMQLVDRYRSSPQMFAAELPYHPAETLYALAERLTVIDWWKVVGPLTARRASDDPVTARVRKEMRRRIQGAPMAAAAGA
jgi:hypothetical protein